MAKALLAGLLTLAALFAYALPGHAVPAPTPAAVAAFEQVADTPAVGAADAGDEHGQLPCEDTGHRGDAACCSVAHCATMHGGVLPAGTAAFVPHAAGVLGPPVLATPDGIDGAPAPRPPSSAI